MSLKKFLTSNVFFKHLGIAILLVVVVLFITMKGLKIYTRHGQSLPVPDFTGLTSADIQNTARLNQLKFEIIDSVYVNDKPRGAVVDQEPEPGFRVKENRTIFLTINSNEPEKVALPKLTDVSFRQAQVFAENVGIRIGNISYEPSEYNDLVLRVEQDSMDVFPGQFILKGSAIDLIVGRSRGNEETPLPDLIGFTTDEAKLLLTNAMLNTGVVIYDKTVTTAEDSINAVVWRQYPSSKNTKQISLGSTVDIWLTTDMQKIDHPLFKEE